MHRLDKENHNIPQLEKVEPKHPEEEHRNYAGKNENLPPLQSILLPMPIFSIHRKTSRLFSAGKNPQSKPAICFSIPQRCRIDCLPCENVRNGLGFEKSRFLRSRIPQRTADCIVAYRSYQKTHFLSSIGWKAFAMLKRGDKRNRLPLCTAFEVPILETSQ